MGNEKLKLAITSAGSRQIQRRWPCQSFANNNLARLDGSSRFWPSSDWAFNKTPFLTSALLASVVVEEPFDVAANAINMDVGTRQPNKWLLSLMMITRLLRAIQPDSLPALYAVYLLLFLLKYQSNSPVKRCERVGGKSLDRTFILWR